MRGDAFDPDEVFEIAEEIERNGARFYRRAAELTDDADVAALLQRLAAMEDEHLRTFAELRRSGPEGSAPLDPDGTLRPYLEAVAAGHVFDYRSDPTAWLEGGADPRAVLDRAIQMEKDSVVFYLGLRDANPLDFGKQRIDDVIVEELRHVTLLSQQRARLTDDG